MKNVCRISALLLALLMLVSLFACGEGKDPSTESQESSQIPSSEESLPEESETGDNNAVSVKEAIQTLSSSLFQNNIVTKKSTVATDLSVMGVDQDKYDNEMLYPYPDTFDHVYNVNDYGITPEQEPVQNSKKLNALFEELASVEGTKKVMFPVGDYRFKTTLNIENVSDLYICSDTYGQCFNIIFTNWIHAMQVNNSQNVHLRDYTLDYDPSSTVAGEIVSYSMANKTITVRIYDEFDMTNTLYHGGLFFTTHSYMEYVWDELTQDYVPDWQGNLKYDWDPTNGCETLSYDNDTRLLTLQINAMAEPFVGKKVSVSYTEHQNFGLAASHVDKFYLENVFFYHTCGMGFGVSCCSEVYVNHFRIDLKPGSTRLMTCTADGLHSTDVQKLVVTNSCFRHTHDDALNVKSWYKDITSITNTTIVCSSTSANFPMNEGDELEVFDSKDFHLVGTYKIVKVLEVTGATYKLKLDKKIGDGSNVSGYLLANTSRGTRLTFKNNLVGNKRNRGILVQCRESHIENNTFYNIVHGTLCIYTIRDSASEGICPKNIYVENNKFLQNVSDINCYTWGTSGKSAGVMRNIYIRNNFFGSNHNTCMGMYGLGDSEITNNILYNTALEGSLQAMSLSLSVNTIVKDNTVYLDENPRNYVVLAKGGNLENCTVEANNKKLFE